MKSCRTDLEKRMLRVEAVVWVLLAINGLKGGADLLPIVSALLSGG